MIEGTPEITSDEDATGRIGELLRAAHMLSDPQAAEAADYAQAHGVRFGEAAIALGFVSDAELRKVLARQFDLSTPLDDAYGEPVAYTRPQSQAAEDYKSIRNAITLRWFRHPQGAKTLAVVSPQRGDGRSLMTANLAICCAQVGYRTLLIDADMRSPRIHNIFGISNEQGLSSYLSGRADERAIFSVPNIKALSILSAGPTPPNPQELLLRNNFEQLVNAARERFDMIIIDTPAAEAGADYQIVAAEAIGALVVTHAKTTRTRAAKNLVRACQGFGIRIVGSVMTGTS